MVFIAIDLAPISHVNRTLKAESHRFFQGNIDKFTKIGLLLPGLFADTRFNVILSVETGNGEIYELT